MLLELQPEAQETSLTITPAPKYLSLRVFNRLKANGMHYAN